MKRIITCSDGTWNQPDVKDRGVIVQSNVEKMFNSICSFGKSKDNTQDVGQVKAYDQGVGTGYSALDKISGGITGAGIDKNIKDLYTFLCINYEPGDELYLFGFSRGAYTARSLAGLIKCCGVLKPANIHLVDDAYNLYRDRNRYSLPSSDMMKAWRSNFSQEDITEILFMGVWDTVGALGIPLTIFKSFNHDKYKFHDCTLGTNVKYAYHALAINEKRRLFQPTLWNLSTTVMNDPEHPQVLEQRWFAGAHANIGGGYADSGLSDITLDWLIKKAEDVGLCFHNPPSVKTMGNYKGEIRNSFTARYWLWLTKTRTIDLNDPLSRQTIDESVWQRYDEDSEFRPGNLPNRQGQKLQE
jgi:uncharacterized protein (DUF2235 family)